jgi:hypothetical protein
MRDPSVAVPADQPDAPSGVDSKTDIENMGSGACLNQTRWFRLSEHRQEKSIKGQVYTFYDFFSPGSLSG